MPRCIRAATLVVFLGMATPLAAAPTAISDGSTYTGVHDAGHDVDAYLGVPFAAPPTGERRWRPPQAWQAVAQVDATRYAPACQQGRHMVEWYRDVVARFGGDPDTFPVPAFSEDCLYLNIWTPTRDVHDELPVMVWIHGGSHLGGWSYEPNYVGAALAAHGVVVISIAYRVDVFGFFSHPDLEDANFGLLDQIEALRWVRAHIAAFGGDPDNVTVFGESAGASSIGYLLASPLAEGLMRRAIHQSAGYEFVNNDRREDFLDEGLALQKKVLGADAGTGIAALRQADGTALVSAAELIYADYRPDAVIDGRSLVEPPTQSLAAHHIGAVDLLIGTNADEWKMYLDADTSADDVQAWLSEHGNAKVAGMLDASATPRWQLDRLITARQYVCPSQALASYEARSGKRAWVYRFERVRPGDFAASMGAYHGAEIPYMFGTPDTWLPETDVDRRLESAMMDYWVAFAKSGDPNIARQPAWPAWSAARPRSIRLGDSIDSGVHPDAALCTALEVRDGT